MGYKHLNIDERESILKMLSEEKNITHIAELLGRNKGTIIVAGSVEPMRTRTDCCGSFFQRVRIFTKLSHGCLTKLRSY